MIQTVVLLLLVQLISSNIFIPKEDSKIEAIEQYLNNLMKTLEISNNDLIISYIDWNYRFDYPWILIGDTSKHISLINHQKGSIFIIENNFGAVLEYFSKQYFWESHPKFILISEDKPSEIFKLISKYYIYNIMVLFQNRTYTNFPFLNENGRNFEVNFRTIPQ